MNGMIQISIPHQLLEHSISGLRDVQRRFPLAVARTVTRTMEGMGVDAAREASKRYFVKVKDVKATIEYRKATAGNLMGTMISRGKRHSLADYKLTPNTPRQGKKPQLMGAVKREGGLKPLGPAFLVKRANSLSAGSGKYFPAYRLGQGSGNRWKGIKSLISPSVPQILKNEEIVQAIEQKATERFANRLDHEILYFLGVLP